MTRTMLAILCVLSATVAYGQTRDVTGAPAAPATGTSVIAGRVMSDEPMPRPLHHVLVQLSSGGLTAPLGAMTDEKGQFTFLRLPAHTYSLSASRAGFVTAFYGAKRAGKGPGVPIAVAAGQRLDGIDVKMLHGGVITGTIRLENGRPAAGVQVSVLDMRTVNGQRQSTLNLTSMSSAAALLGQATDDRGMYRIYGLAPADYAVVAQPIRAEALAASFLSSGVNPNPQPTTAADVQWAQIVTSSPNAPITPAPPAARAIVYAPEFYPGTPDLAAATAISLGPGEERGGIDFTVTPVPAAKVTGTVVDLDGRPTPGAQVQLKSTRTDVADIMSMVQSLLGAGSTTDASGGFAFSGVTPGAYTIEVRAAVRRGAAAGGGSSSTPPALGALAAIVGLVGGGTGSQPVLWATQAISVDGSDISGLSLTLQPGASVTGKVVFDGTIDPPKDLKQVRVLMTPVSGSSQMAQIAAVSGLAMGTAGDDGTFTVAGVTPNTYRAQITVPGMLMPGARQASGWVLRSLMANGRDVSDAPLEIAPAGLTGLVATFTDRVTELSGSMVDHAGAPLPSFPLVVFSTDRANWIAGSRRVQQARPAQNGTYTVVGLPPGEYYVTAVTELDQNDLYDPAFLDTLAPTAIRITLTEGEKKVQDLKLGG